MSKDVTSLTEEQLSEVRALVAASSGKPYVKSVPVEVIYEAGVEVQGELNSAMKKIKKLKRKLKKSKTSQRILLPEEDIETINTIMKKDFKSLTEDQFYTLGVLIAAARRNADAKSIPTQVIYETGLEAEKELAEAKREMEKLRKANTSLKKEIRKAKRAMIYTTNANRPASESEEANKHLEECPVCNSPGIHLAYLRIHGMCTDCRVKHEASLTHSETKKHHRDTVILPDEDSQKKMSGDLDRLVTVILIGEDGDADWLVFEESKFNELVITSKPDEISDDIPESMKLYDLFNQHDWSGEYISFINCLTDGLYPLHVFIREATKDDNPQLTFAQQKHYLDRFFDDPTRHESYPVLANARYSGYSWMGDTLDFDATREVCVCTYVRNTFW